MSLVSVFPITLTIKFKLFNMTLDDGPLPTSPASFLPPSASLYPGNVIFSRGLQQEALVQHGLLSLLEASSLPSFLAAFSSSFRSQCGYHFLWEAFLDTLLCAGILYHHLAVLSYDTAIA